MSDQLGSFRLLTPLARGGMGEVWKAQHATLGVPVAVKVLTDAAYRRSELGQALQAELRAVAQLDHPHIVRVHDAGVVPEGVGTIPPNSPWLAMELLQGGSIARQPRGDWAQLRRVLEELLGALAHAHAHGVLHRDLKPGNVLVDDEGNTRLTDFGMVYALDAHGAPIRGGTPAWCAPEQLRSAWLEQGPWTDLYGLGCLAWALTTGRRPFEPTSPDALLRAQRSGVGAFEPRTAVPADLEDWLRRALAPDPADRWARAADALHALHALPSGSPDLDPTEEVDPETLEDRTLTASSAPTQITPRLSGDSGARSLVPGRSAGLPVVPRAHAPPPLPAAWVHHRRPPDPAAFAVGLGLYRLRSLPLVGRSTERARLWDHVCRVHEQGRVGVVVLQGPAGVGKTHLATALAQHAHTTGAAEVLRLTAQPGRTLEELLRARHRAHGLSPDEVRRVVLATTGAEQVDDPWEQQMLARITAGDAMEVPQATRWRLALRMLDRLAGPRLTLAVIDDAPRDADILRFAAWASGAIGPVLLVLTARDEDVVVTADADELLDVLVERGADRIRVGPLDATAHRVLLETLLPLDPDLVAQVAHRTAGNPLFAVQVVGDWVGRGLLRATRHGLELSTDAPAELPDDVRAVWTARIAPILEALPAWRAPLEVAAALDDPVQADEWAEACTRLGLKAPSGLPARLHAEGLARVEQGGLGSRWSFTHGMLRESILAEAHAAGRHEEVHAAIAETLEGRGAAPDRRALHWLAAGRPGRAVDALRPWALSRQPYDLAENARIGAVAIHAAEAAGPGADDVLAAALVHRAHALARLRSRPGSTLDMVERGLAAALRCDAWETALRACAYLSWTHRIVGHLDQHVAFLEHGQQLMEDHPELRGTGAWVSWMSARTMEAGFRRAIDEQVVLMDEILAVATDDYDLVRTLARKASTLSVYGRNEQAARVLAELDPLVASSGLDDALQLGVTVSLARGTVLREVGDLEGSVAAFAHALQAAERKGSREDAWLVRHRWAEAVRAAGDWEAAARAHREMFAETAMFAHTEGQVGAALCLGLALLDGGRGEEAEAVMDDLAVTLGSSEHWADGLMAGIRAAAAALQGDRARTLTQLQLAATTLRQARESWFGVLHHTASARGWDDILAALEPLTPDRASAR